MLQYLYYYKKVFESTLNIRGTRSAGTSDKSRFRIFSSVIGYMVVTSTNTYINIVLDVFSYSYNILQYQCDIEVIVFTDIYVRTKLEKWIYNWDRAGPNWHKVDPGSYHSGKCAEIRLELENIKRQCIGLEIVPIESVRNCKNNQVHPGTQALKYPGTRGYPGTRYQYLGTGCAPDAPRMRPGCAPGPVQVPGTSCPQQRRVSPPSPAGQGLITRYGTDRAAPRAPAAALVPGGRPLAPGWRRPSRLAPRGCNRLLASRYIAICQGCRPAFLAGGQPGQLWFWYLVTFCKIYIVFI